MGAFKTMIKGFLKELEEESKELELEIEDKRFKITLERVDGEEHESK